MSAKCRHLSTFARRFLIGLLAIAVFGRLVQATWAAASGDLEPFVSFGFTVIFPATLATALLQLGPTKSAEGMFMRIGTTVQLTAIIAIPPLGLALLLGLPIVFLVVEMIETRAPAWLRVAFHQLAFAP